MMFAVTMAELVLWPLGILIVLIVLVLLTPPPGPEHYQDCWYDRTKRKPIERKTTEDGVIGTVQEYKPKNPRSSPILICPDCESVDTNNRTRCTCGGKRVPFREWVEQEDDWSNG